MNRNKIRQSISRMLVALLMIVSVGSDTSYVYAKSYYDIPESEALLEETNDVMDYSKGEVRSNTVLGEELLNNFEDIDRNDDSGHTLASPTNLRWSQGSTATAMWDTVEGATYYNVTVIVEDTIPPEIDEIGRIQTGTSSTSIDLQEQINNIASQNNINGIHVFVRFSLQAITFEGSEVANTSDVVELSDEYRLYYLVGEIPSEKYDAPKDVMLNNDLTANWNTVSGSVIYNVDISIVCNGKDYGRSWSYETNSVDLEPVISNHIVFCYDTGTDLYGKTASIKIKVCAAGKGEFYPDGNRQTSDWSESNTIIYTIPYPEKKLPTVTNAVWKDKLNYIINWDNVARNCTNSVVARKYEIQYRFIVPSDQSRVYTYTSTKSYTNSKDSESSYYNIPVDQEVAEMDISKDILYFYNKIKLYSETLTFDFRVRAISSGGVYNTDYLDGDYSDWSEAISYAHRSPLPLDSATDLEWKSGDGYIGTWNAQAAVEEGATNFLVKFRFIDPETGTKLSSSMIGGETKNRINARRNFVASSVPFEVDLEEKLYNNYIGNGLSGKRVNVQYCLKSLRLETYGITEYKSATSYSEWSTIIEYSAEKQSNTKTKFVAPTGADLHWDTGTNVASWESNEYVETYDMRFLITSVDDSIIYKDSSSSVFDLHTLLIGIPREQYERDGYIYTPDLVYTYISEFCDSYLTPVYGDEVFKLRYRFYMIPYSADKNHVVNDFGEWSSDYITYRTKEYHKVQSIHLSPSAPIICKGKSYYLGKTITPDYARYSSVNWSSDNESIVRVSSEGQITGVSVGTTFVNATIDDVTARVPVTVYDINSNIENADDNQQVTDTAGDIIDDIANNDNPSIGNTDIDPDDIDDIKDEIHEAIENGDTFHTDIVYIQQYFDKYKKNWGQVQKAARNLNAQFVNAYNIEVEMYHKDKDNNNHHIGNITDLDNEISFTFDLTAGNNKYVLVRIHKNSNGETEYTPIEFTDNHDGTGTAKSDKFSDFVLVTVDGHLHDYSYKASGSTITATCKNTGCDITSGLTLTLSPPDNLTYDGESKAASLNDDYNKIVYPDTYVIEYYDGAEKLSYVPVNAGTYTAKVTVEKATASVTYTIAKKTHEDVSKTSVANFGLVGSIDLSDLIEEGGTLGTVSISGESGILDGIPSISGTTLNFKLSDNANNVGKGIIATIPVTGSKNYQDYSINVTLTVINCDHEHTEIRNAKEANCTEHGYTGDTYCKDCGGLIQEGDETPIDLNNHTFDEGVIIIHPTILTEGTKILTCVRCNYAHTEIVPSAEGENDVSDLIKDITDENGNTNGEVKTKEKEDGSKETIVKVGGEEVEKTVEKDGETTVETHIWIGGLGSSYKYTGSEIKPEIHVYDGTKKLGANEYSVSYKNNKEVGTNASITVSFKGNYKETPPEIVTFAIDPAVLGTDIKAEDMAITSTNKTQEPIPSMMFTTTGKKIDKKNFNFVYSKDGANITGITGVGTYMVTITSKNTSYVGKETATIEVIGNKKLLLPEAKVELKPNKFIYTGSPIIPAKGTYKLKLNDTYLTEDKDFVVSDIINNVDVGKATIVFTAKEDNTAGYVGSNSVTFTISKGRTLMEQGAKGSDFTYEYNKAVPYSKGGAKPEVVVKDGDTILNAGVDYTVSYSKNTKITDGETAVMTVKGKGNYKGSVKLYYAVTGQSISALSAGITVSDKIESKKGYKNPTVTIIDLDGKKLKAGTDFVIDPNSYSEPNKKGIVTAIVLGKGKYTGNTPISYRYIKAEQQLGKANANKIKDKMFSGGSVTLSNADFTNILYTGSSKNPKYLIPGTDFIVAGYSDDSCIIRTAFL